ncbi:hypothetical protein C7445_10764 [Alicyclobacillus sacchari]|uniref:Asp23/Gls24 family envelope stress response protein n=2 Tax=Alicyclobacillus sacchari TaxID=392010 RepID=A0A4R8LLS8_9BACL|nr:hypothetical protein C7445_10764 [Alicyclobacillus sacchari]
MRMADLLQIQVKHPGIALTEKEQKLIACLVQRICVHHLHRRLGRRFRIRPANVDSIHLVVHQTVAVEDGISNEELSDIVPDLVRDIRDTLAWCDVVAEDIVLVAKA